MKTPNPWHEDEERKQSILCVDNLSSLQSVTGTITCYVQARFQFGPLIFNPSAMMGLARAPALPEGAPSGASSFDDLAASSPAGREDEIVDRVVERMVALFTQPGSPILRAIRGLQLEPE